MLVVIGALVARDGKLDALLALSRTHVERSRGEPGCVSHRVSIDAGNPMQLVFVEEWVDRAALQVHFAVPASRAFVKAALKLTVGAPVMTLYDAQPTTV